jgi:hypothetical protein
MTCFLGGRNKKYKYNINKIRVSSYVPEGVSKICECGLVALLENVIWALPTVKEMYWWNRGTAPRILILGTN